MVQLITILLTFFTLSCLSVSAQEAEPYKRGSVLKTYRTCMKEKNFARARQVLVDAIQKHPMAATDNQIRRHVVEAINEQIGEENRKIYLNNRPDTVAYFNRIYDLYVAALACDSVEQHNIQQKQSIGKKAKVQQRFYLGQTLLPYRTNLLGGGK